MLSCQAPQQVQWRIIESEGVMANTSTAQAQEDRVSLLLSRELRQALIERAAWEDRSVSAEIREAIRAVFIRPGNLEVDALRETSSRDTDSVVSSSYGPLLVLHVDGPSRAMSRAWH
jgi:hypothetical protein